MTALTFQWDSKGLNPFRNRSIERAIERVTKASGNRAIRDAKVTASRYVRGRKRLKVKFVNDSLPVTNPKGRALGDLEWRMRVSGSPVPLIDYPHRQVGARTIGSKGRRERVSGGVMVGVNKGRMKLIKSAFVAKMKSGHKGIFSRGLDGRRLPIHELFSSRVSDVFNDNGMIPAVFERATTTYNKSFAYLLPLELAKAK